MLVLEEAAGVTFAPPAGLVSEEIRVVGDSQVAFLRLP
jgi:hypothetical protein